MYEDHLDELGKEPRKMFTLLAEKLEEEEELIVSLTQLQGSLQMILSGAEIAPLVAAKENQNLLEPSDAAQTERDLVLNIA